MADGRLRTEWEQTGVIAAKIHNAFFQDPVTPYEFGPYGVQRETVSENKMSVAEIAEAMKEFGVKVKTVPTPEWLKEELGVE